MIFVGFIRRERLSLLGSVYAFVQKHYESPVRLWDSVRREIDFVSSSHPVLVR